MDFIGDARRLTEHDISCAARDLGCDVAAVKAVLDVEARGRGFDRKGRPVILFEPHIFYRQLGPGSRRSRAISEHLATRSARAIPYPKSQDMRYRQLQRAMRIDGSAALRSVSWGLGQVMGFNHAAAGFDTVEQMVEALKESEGAQLMAMVHFIRFNGLHTALAVRNWATFARGYNGPAYRRNRYDLKLARAYTKHRNRSPDTILAKPEIEMLQRILKEIGFDTVFIDGIDGPLTQKALRAFQGDAGLRVDGIAGPRTWAALRARQKSIMDRKEHDMTDAKPWFKSRAIWGALTTIAASIAGFAGLQVEPQIVEQATSQIVLLLSAGGGLLSLVGRVFATSRISP
ncbi:MAG: N-acetylmuramidase domain-containing protein [Pseudomonadota bacterium]